MKIRKVAATRYVTPLKEGGSLPAIIEADDDGLYVLKFRGAGQGVKALIAELIAGELGRAAGLLIPEIVFVDLDADLSKTEPDPEIRDLIKASAGLNLALDYLPGSIAFDPVAERPDEKLSSEIVWFDAFITNIDRTPRNTNMLMWHKRMWLIDHGAAFYFHHSWNNYKERSNEAFPMIKDHVLLLRASLLREADEKMSALITPALITDVVNTIPEEWLKGNPLFGTLQEHREAYIQYLVNRLKMPHQFLEEAIRARSL